MAIVHNGQLTNYYTWRRRLQRQGYRFTTENDSELIAVWNSDRMAAGDSLQESLERSLTELDGVFTYLLATGDGIGLAKDRWAIKPVVAAVAPDGVAVATEEQSLRTLYQQEIEVDVYDGPNVVRIWPASCPGGRRDGGVMAAEEAGIAAPERVIRAADRPLREVNAEIRAAAEAGQPVRVTEPCRDITSASPCPRAPKSLSTGRWATTAAG